MNNSLLALGHVVRNQLWKVFRSITIGVRVIALKGDEVLVVWHTYRNYWYFPGGGLKSGETIQEAARRELYEETGFVIGDISLLGLYTDFSDGRSDHIVVLYGDVRYKCDKYAKSDEIAKIEFFPLDNLPDNILPGCKDRIQEYLHKRGPHCTTWL